MTRATGRDRCKVTDGFYFGKTRSQRERTTLAFEPMWIRVHVGVRERVMVRFRVRFRIRFRGGGMGYGVGLWFRSWPGSGLRMGREAYAGGV